MEKRIISFAKREDIINKMIYIDITNYKAEDKYKEIKEHLKNIEYNAFNKDRYDLFVGNTHTPCPNPHMDIKRDTDGGSKNTPSSKISKLREDIQAGRVVKIPTRNGFIWKRVK